MAVINSTMVSRNIGLPPKQVTTGDLQWAKYTRTFTMYLHWGLNSAHCTEPPYVGIDFVTDWPPHQLLVGHQGRVNCLLYPNHAHPRYERAHLLSGGEDFAVCLWDLYAGTLLHRFCVHAGEITQLMVPPNTCSVSCVCSSIIIVDVKHQIHRIIFLNV